MGEIGVQFCYSILCTLREFHIWNSAMMSIFHMCFQHCLNLGTVVIYYFDYLVCIVTLLMFISYHYEHESCGILNVNYDQCASQ